jgi:hypothetical protein
MSALRASDIFLSAGECGFPVIRQAVGGIGSRQLVFDLRSGKVSLTRGAAMPSGVQVVAGVPQRAR